MSDSTFANIPPAELKLERWREHFAPLAARARETTFGLPDEQRRVLALCVELEVALAAERVYDEKLGKAYERINELERKVKGLQLQLGRAKKAKKEGKAS